MTLHDAKQLKADAAAEYLMGVRAAYFRAKRLRTMALEQRRALGIVRGIDYSACQPHGNATDADGAMVRAIDAADRARQRADEAEAEWSALCDEATAAAARMEDALEECVLTMYYITPCGTWAEIAAANGYTYDGIMKVRARALASFHDVMPRSMRVV